MRRKPSIPRAVALLGLLIMGVLIYRSVFFVPPPVYLVFSETSTLSAAERNEIITSAGLDLRGWHLRVLDEAETTIATEHSQIPPRLAQLNAEDPRPFVLFQLRPPMRDSKKQLAAFMGDTYRGALRAESLRRLVVVTEIDVPPPLLPDEGTRFAAPLTRFDVLCDAAVFANDTFGGIALLVRDTPDEAAGLYRRALACWR